MPDNRPAVYLEDNTVIYRASAIGHCLRQLWAARSGMSRHSIPAIVQRGMDEGRALEPVILDLLREQHDFVFDGGSQYVVELHLGEHNGHPIIVRGALDEIGGNDGVNRPIDVKALTQEQIDAGIPDYYWWQQSVYSIAYGEPYYMPIFNKSTWKIEPSSLFYQHPKYTRTQIRNRIVQVENAFHLGVMPEECPGDFACPYPYLHDSKQPDNLPDDTVAIARARIKLSERIKTLEQARKTLDEAISPKLHSGITYALDDYTITLYANPNRFDTKAAQKLLTDNNIEFEHCWKPGKGTQLRMAQKKASRDGDRGRTIQP